MADLRIVLAVLFVAGATQINGDDVKPIKLPEGVPTPGYNASQYYPLVSLIPVGVRIQPYFPIGLAPNPQFPTIPVQSTLGRLLTPEQGCGTTSVGLGRVVGGAPAKNGAWPWMALLGYANEAVTDFGGFNCAGSLITSRHVLSAAHCMNNKLWFARLGEHDVRTGNDGKHEDIQIAKWEAHAGWNPQTMINDIAMVYLAQDVQFTDRIRAVCLPINSPMQSQRFVGQNPFVTGWGNTAEGGQQSPILLQLQVPIVDNLSCAEVFRRIGLFQDPRQFSDMVICAGYIAGQSSCHGDSGGPLQMPFNVNGKFAVYQIGVVSWGVGCARPNIPAIYSNVQYFASWINQKLQS